MSWSLGFDTNWNRDIGYGVPAFCDHPDCSQQIDRGLGSVCGNGEPYGGDRGCGLYFCGKHGGASLCARCSPRRRKPFAAKPDHPRWLHFKMRDISWAAWRLSQGLIDADTQIAPSATTELRT